MPVFAQVGQCLNGQQVAHGNQNLYPAFAAWLGDLSDIAKRYPVRRVAEAEHVVVCSCVASVVRDNNQEQEPRNAPVSARERVEPLLCQSPVGPEAVGDLRGRPRLDLCLDLRVIVLDQVSGGDLEVDPGAVWLLLAGSKTGSRGEYLNEGVAVPSLPVVLVQAQFAAQGKPPEACFPIVLIPAPKPFAT